MRDVLARGCRSAETNPRGIRFSGGPVPAFVAAAKCRRTVPGTHLDTGANAHWLHDVQSERAWGATQSIGYAYERSDFGARAGRSRSTSIRLSRLTFHTVGSAQRRLAGPPKRIAFNCAPRKAVRADLPIASDRVVVLTIPRRDVAAIS